MPRNRWMFTTAFGQFSVTEIGENGEIAWDLNQHHEAYYLLTSPADRAGYDARGGIIEEDLEVDFINTGQAGSGRFGDLEEFEPLIGGDDYAMDARAEVTIPAGTWSIGFGGDDGGQLTLQTTEGSDIAFSSTFNTNGTGNYRIRTAPATKFGSWVTGVTTGPVVRSLLRKKRLLSSIRLSTNEVVETTGK